MYIHWLYLTNTLPSMPPFFLLQFEWTRHDRHSLHRVWEDFSVCTSSGNVLSWAGEEATFWPGRGPLWPHCLPQCKLAQAKIRTTVYMYMYAWLLNTTQRELANQTYDTVKYFSEELANEGIYAHAHTHSTWTTYIHMHVQASSVPALIRLPSIEVSTLYWRYCCERPDRSAKAVSI